jgi:DnaJ-class molecular chaperone
MPEDFYQTLELPRTASPGDIKRAFRRLARKYHPDLNPGDPTAEDRMEDLNLAYEVLSDKKRRADYDVFSRETTPEKPRKQEPSFEEAAARAAALERLSPYEILGVPPKATYRAIRDAFSSFVATHGEAAISDPAAALAYQHIKSAYRLLSSYERRRRYHADHGLPEPPHPENEDAERPLGVMDGLGDMAWIAPAAIGFLLFLLLLLTVFRPYWL